jgi:hypothetical protein
MILNSILLYSILAVVAAQKSLLIYSDIDASFALDVRTNIMSTNMISVVDMFDARTATPTIEVLKMYSSVMLWGSVPFNDPVLLGNILADYIDAGFTVVVSLNSMSTFTPIKGRFESGAYLPVKIDTTKNITFSLGTRVVVNANETNPFLAGVAKLQGNFDDFV